MTRSLKTRTFLGAISLIASEASAVSTAPYELTQIGPLPITNSMVMGWIISVAVIVGIRLMVGKPTLVPSKGQAVIESAIEGVRGIMEPIVGKKMFGPTFPLLVGIFFFILMHNWSGLLPGVGAFGLYDDHGHLIYWWRPANADLNMTIAIALISGVFAWLYFVLRYAGFKTLIIDLFGNKANRKDVGTPIWLLLIPVFIGVGFIEVISIIFRPVSLSFRLFGNVFGGENLLTNMTGIVPYIVPVPFYFLETLIGLVQALVFTLLTAVYIGLICNHGEEHH
jgi:F-type H+-transporting ATPase subunit a|tara:strand:+ start:3529 stop:4371 length:843 start_codon:yes stop_codon:yes gene_type:complete